jgi:hypothetical protein
MDDEYAQKNKPVLDLTSKPLRVATDELGSLEDNDSSYNQPLSNAVPASKPQRGPSQLSGKKKLLKLINMARKKTDSVERK